MNAMDTEKIRFEVFKLYGVSVPNPILDPPSLILKRAHYTYIADSDFDHRVRAIKDEHERHLIYLLKDLKHFKHLEDFYAEERGSTDNDKVHPLDTQNIIEVEPIDLETQSEHEPDLLTNTTARNEVKLL